MPFVTGSRALLSVLLSAGLNCVWAQRGPATGPLRVLALQEAYVGKVIDTVNDLDNVLYEICNEAGAYSTDWQYHLIRFIKKHQAGKPKQHPVGMTFQYKGGTNAALLASPANWISPNPGEPLESYRENPPSAHQGKVVVSDTDHLWGHTGGDAVWVWKSFCRGLNVLFMEELLPSPTWQDSARKGMEQTRRFAERVNLAAMVPEDRLSATHFRRGVVQRVRRSGDPGQAGNRRRGADLHHAFGGPGGPVSEAGGEVGWGSSPGFFRPVRSKTQLSRLAGWFGR